MGLGPAGTGNKYTFHKVSQIVISQGLASAKCMYFRKLLQICFHRNTLASFCKDLQINFRKDLQVQKSWISAKICNEHFAEVFFAWTGAQVDKLEIALRELPVGIMHSSSYYANQLDLSYSVSDLKFQNGTGKAQSCQWLVPGTSRLGTGICIICNSIMMLKHAINTHKYAQNKLK